MLLVISSPDLYDILLSSVASLCLAFGSVLSGFVLDERYFCAGDNEVLEVSDNVGRGPGQLVRISKEN